MDLLWFVTVILYSTDVAYSSVGGEANHALEVLTWNFTIVNPGCDYPRGKTYCADVRICTGAVASLRMGGRPPICSWVGKDVPRVCCGLPLILGKELMKQVQRERARTRECGTIVNRESVSPTEQRFHEILKTVPRIDISDPNKFDPPLDLSDQSIVLPVGGVRTIEGKYPWMVAIFRGMSFWCGGALIDTKHVLSAAHCYVDSRGAVDPARYTVRVGSIYLNRTLPYNVSKIVVHENYNVRTYYNDIAMLTLEEEIGVPEVPHICLPDGPLATRDFTGLNTTLLGWGNLAFGGANTPILHEVKDIPVVANDQCGEIYAPITRDTLPQGLTEDFICAGLDEGGKDACQRDSGGPLMYHNNVKNLPPDYLEIPWVLVGIVSFGNDCGQPGYPGVYTRVSSYMEWIVRNSV